MYTKIISTSHRSNKVVTTFGTNLIEAFSLIKSSKCWSTWKDENFNNKKLVAS